MRLLFSSAQIEYIRYYLHACGLTKALIPIPSSHYLIQASDLRNCSPDVYHDDKVLKRSIKVRPRTPRRRRRAGANKLLVCPAPPFAMMCAAPLSASRPASCPASSSQLAVPVLAEPEPAPAPPRRRRNRGRKRSKNIDKNNKRLKGAGDMLALRRLTFERVRTLWAARLGTWCAMDFEAWDRDHALLTEFGWSAARWPADAPPGAEPARARGHLVVKERRHYSQTYVPNNKEVRACVRGTGGEGGGALCGLGLTRCRQFYNFGQSELVDKHEFKRRICELVEQYKKEGPLFLVFHDNSQDIKSAASLSPSRVHLPHPLTRPPICPR